MLTRGRSRKSNTGARIVANQKKKKYNMVRETLLTRVGESRKKRIPTRGGGIKNRLTLAETANVMDSKTGKVKKVKITGVAGNPANMQYVKRNILNKSAVIETEAGKARVTSRPGQDGIVNAVLITE